MTSPAKTWLIILAAAVAALVGEGVTVAVFGYPMSHAMADAPEIAGLLFAFFAGLLLAHFRWPAKSRWRKQDEEIARFGSPPMHSPFEIAQHAIRLWWIHRGEKP